jgi:hypothetical protein
MKKQTYFSVATIALTAILVSTTPTHAQILWGSAKNVITDTDVLTNGTYFDADVLDTNVAFGVGATGSAGLSDFLTINGVAFNTIGGQNVGADPSGDISINSGRNPFTGANSPSGSAAYNTLIGHEEYAQNGPQTITLNHLTIGDTYQIQVWSAALGDPAFVTDLSGLNTVSLTASTGQYAVGTFLATTATLAFTATNDATSINGVDMLNAVSVFNEGVLSAPEPSTYALLLAGLLTLGIIQSRRQKSQTL